MKDSYYFKVIIIGFATLFATTLLLDLRWIQKHISRQMIVYLIMLLQIFILYQKLFNRKK